MNYKTKITLYNVGVFFLRNWFLSFIIIVVLVTSFLPSPPDIHKKTDDVLDQALDITVDTIYSVEEQISKTLDNTDESHLSAFLVLASALEDAYNKAIPKLDEGYIGVIPMADASLGAFRDVNANLLFDPYIDNVLFIIEVDGENSRLIATGSTGAVSERRIATTASPGFLTGALISSMLLRQSRAGVTSGQLARKKPVSAKSAARARAGSGSYSRGK